MEEAEQSPNPPELKDAQGSRGAALCPYCGHASANRKECDRCRGVFEPLSRQASQNAMGPWFIRDEANPFRPGCSYATITALVGRKRIDGDTVLRGPSTRQFWLRARNVPGVANLLGECHACHKPASPSAAACTHCAASFVVEDDRQFLGLAEVRVVPVPGAPAKVGKAAAKPVASPEADSVVEQQPTVPDAPTEPHSFEPIRHPARGVKAAGSLSDEQIEEMLRKGRAYDRANSSTRLVTILVGLAIVAVVVAIIFAVVMFLQNQPNAAATGGSTTPAGAAKPATGR